MEALISLVALPNAPLAPEGRLILVELVIEDGWGKARVAERLHVSLATISKWVRRHRADGKAGHPDHSPCPQCSPHRIDLHSGIWHRTNTYCESLGITVKRVLSDNGSCFRPTLFNTALGGKSPIDRVHNVNVKNI